MKTIRQTLQALLTLSFILIGSAAYSQSVWQPELQYFRYTGTRGLNVFESPKQDSTKFDGMKIKLGGDFAMQFQGISQSNDAATGSEFQLVDLGSDFNLPTANLNIDVQLADGVRMSLVNYLSSRHHEEAWVKGGHIQIDKLDFISPGFLSGLMEIASFKIGLDEINYGDAHFRRTDNARAIYNPFVGNYIMDAFTTEAFGEFYLQKNGFIGMLGVSNGKLNQNVVKNDNTDNKMSFYGKLGYDKQTSDDLRIRLTGSWYINNGHSTGRYLYAGDRAGSRYYKVMDVVGADANDFSGRKNVRFNELTAIQFNPFVKYKGLEFFGIYEVASDGDQDGKYTQTAAELIYRFGESEKVYIGGRYNMVKGERVKDAATEEIRRINFGGGWYLTPNVMAKLEYVNQQYSGDGNTGAFDNAEFKGVVIEATIGF